MSTAIITPNPTTSMKTLTDRHGGGQEFKVLVKAGGLALQLLAEQGELLAKAGEINFSCHFLPQKLEVGRGGDCVAHVPLHRIDPARQDLV